MGNYPNQRLKLTNGIIFYQKSISDSYLTGISFRLYFISQDSVGLPHLLEHVLTHCSNMPDYISIDGHTNTKYISINILGMSDEDYFGAIDTFFDFLINFNVVDADLEIEKKVVIQEINQYLSSSLERFATISRNISFRSNDVFSDPILGSEDIVASVSVKELSQFLKQTLYPDNIVIFATGRESALKRIKSAVSKIDFPKQNSINITSRTREDSLSIDTGNHDLNRMEKARTAYVSLVYNLCSSEVDEIKIASLSFLFSVLNNGKNSILTSLHKKIPKLYFVFANPVVRGNRIYLQILTSCTSSDVTKVSKYISAYFKSISHLSKVEVADTIKNVLFNRMLQFDGAEKSIDSFSKMIFGEEDVNKGAFDDHDQIFDEFEKFVNYLNRQTCSSVVYYLRGAEK
ncbi:insulinase family protein [uncultured Lactobacillus sp.]|uniref:insulinase family protein n=1 Tax=uncultured Lactobacillus sp. TaxID=153152 RepID=UPI0025DAD6EC|nr:insulinase family protein [uncultured Lactobacillus sp.]